MKAVCLWSLLLGLLAIPSQAQTALENRWHPVSIQLVGPLQSVTIDCGRAGDTRMELDLQAGETRSLQVPLAVSPGLVNRDRDVHWQGGGRVEWPEDTEFEAPSGGLLSDGPLPLVPEPVPLLPAPTVLGLIAVALLVFFLRRKPLVMLGVGALGAAGLFLQLGTENRQDPGLVRLIELDEAGPWRVLDSARDSMSYQPGQSIRLWVKPAGQRLHWLVTERGGQWVMQAQSKGALLRKQFEVPPGTKHLDADLNALGNLDQVWVRGDSGRWEARGEWALGAPLPTGALPGEGPPSWLVTGLPQGPEMWVARCAAGTSPFGSGTGVSQTWIRLRRDP